MGDYSWWQYALMGLAAMLFGIACVLGFLFFIGWRARGRVIRVTPEKRMTGLARMLAYNGIGFIGANGERHLLTFTDDGTEIRCHCTCDRFEASTNEPAVFAQYMTDLAEQHKAYEQRAPG